MSGVIIGHGAVIAANSHVVKNVEPYSIHGGNPARLIKKRFDERTIRELLELAWWDKSDETIQRLIPCLTQKPTIGTIRIMKDIIKQLENLQDSDVSGGG